MSDAEAVLEQLRALGSAAHRDGMDRFGIEASRALGVKVPDLRALAKRLGRDDGLARALWASDVHEARILACMVADPTRMTSADLDRWVAGIDSWDLCDGFCGDLVVATADPWAKVEQWCAREETFVRRAGYALLARLAVHDKAAADDVFLGALPLIEAGAGDSRNFVKKAVNWALRQVGKRNAALNAAAVAMAEDLAARSDKTARWIGADARRELLSDKVQAKLRRHVA